MSTFEDDACAETIGLSLVCAAGMMQLPDYEKTEDFATRWKQKAREVLTEIEWRRRKMTLRVSVTCLSPLLYGTIRLVSMWGTPALQGVVRRVRRRTGRRLARTEDGFCKTDVTIVSV